MEGKSGVRISRRMALKLAAVGAAWVGGLARLTGVTEAHDLKPGDPLYHFDEYEARVNRDLTFRQVYQWPNINNDEIWANARNAINAFQFSYGAAPDQIQIILQAYGTASLATYDDYIWQKYRFGQGVKVDDPNTGEPALRNIWYHSKISAADVATPPSDRSDPYYFDMSIEGLQRRGVLFLTCHQSAHAWASEAFNSGRNPDDQTAAEILAEMEQHLVPGALLVPSAVAELVRLQDKGYRLTVNN